MKAFYAFWLASENGNSRPITEQQADRVCAFAGYVVGMTACCSVIGREWNHVRGHARVFRSGSPMLFGGKLLLICNWDLRTHRVKNYFRRRIFSSILYIFYKIGLLYIWNEENVRRTMYAKRKFWLAKVGINTHDGRSTTQRSK